MKYQLDLFGVLIPSLLLWSVVAYALARLVSKLIARAGLYRRIWHPALFDFDYFLEVHFTLPFVAAFGRPVLCNRRPPSKSG